jgi:mannose-1-phosphate guanylyltransferase
VKAVVLAGGEGTRLRPLTYTTPKQLLPVAEIAMLERVLAHLHAHGVDNAVLSLGYRPDSFIAAYPEALVAGVRLSYAVEPEPLDTAGAIRFAADHAGIDSTFVVVNGDVLTDADTSALVEFHRNMGAAATIHLTPVEDPSRFGVVPTDPDGKVVEFVEKPPRGRAPTNLINAGTYVLEPEVLERIPLGESTSIERVTFPQLAGEGTVYAMTSGVYWIDTGTPEAYLRANHDLLAGERGFPPTPGARRVEGVRGADGVEDDVWAIGETQIDGQVGPRTLVGAHAVIERDTTVSDSVIGARCVVEESATVLGSVLLPGTRVGANARIVGSIVGNGAHIEEGCQIEPLTMVGDGELVRAGTRLEGAKVPAEAVS